MTKQGSFKHAARERARATGQRYTEARTDLELANRQEFLHSRPLEQAALKAHLEAHYGIGITSILPIDDDPATRPRDSWPGHYPSTLVVKHGDGHRWIARILSSSADQVSRVQGDAEILKFLASQDVAGAVRTSPMATTRSRLSPQGDDDRDVRRSRGTT